MSQTFAQSVSPPQPVDEQPNVVLVMADDQGWGDMAYNGHPVLKTPHFDAMARQSFRFDRFHAAAPVCSPTRGSVMTGRHPNRFGCFQWGCTLRPQEVTLAEALRQAGYRTGHFGKWHLGSVQRGSPVNPGASGFDQWFSAPNFFDNDPILSRQGQAVQTHGESSMVTVDAAIEFMRDCAAKKEPFLAVVWFGSPHLPHQALPEDRRSYADQPERLQHFYGEITAMDRAFGKLRGELDALGIRENTIFWYCSDNGALPGVGSSGGRRGHKGQVYEGGLLVPAMIQWPARFQGAHATLVPCVTSDIYPTILDWLDITVENQPPLDGVSLVPLVEGREEKRPRPIGFWNYNHNSHGTPSAQWMAELLAAQQAGKTEPPDVSRLRLDAGKITEKYAEGRYPGHSAWLDGDWKLHRIEPEKGGRIKYELYNLADDPVEKVDLLEAQPDRADRMKNELEAWLAEVLNSLNGGDYDSL